MDLLQFNAVALTGAGVLDPWVKINTIFGRCPSAEFASIVRISFVSDCLMMAIKLS
jgi:hypothetical protein